MTIHSSKAVGLWMRHLAVPLFALPLGLLAPGTAAAQSGAVPDWGGGSRSAALAELREIRDDAAEDVVAGMDRQLGTSEAATTTLMRFAPADSHRLADRAFWLSGHWTTGLGVHFAAGPAFEFKAPRSFFLDHLRVLDSWIERAERGEASLAELLSSARSAAASLRNRHALVHAAFFRCHLPGIGLGLRQEKVVDAMLAGYRALPERPVERKRAAWRRYDAARRALVDSTAASTRRCLGLVASAITSPAFEDTLGTIRDDQQDRCHQLASDIDRLKKEFAAAKERFEAAKSRLAPVIKNARDEIARAEQRIKTLEARPRSKALARAEMQRKALGKLITRYQDTMVQLDELRATITALLPRGAQVFLAKSLFDRAGGPTGASEAEKRSFMSVVMGGRWSGRVDDSLEAAVMKARAEATVRVAWPVAKLGDLATKIPTGMLDILGTGLKDLIEGLLSNGEGDPDFVDDPRLKGQLQAAPGQFKAQSAKLDALIDELASEQRRIQTLNGKAADDAAGELIPLAIQIAEEAAALRAALQDQSAQLAAAARRLDAKIDQLEQGAKSLRDEFAALKDAVAYAKTDFIPTQEELIQELEAKLKAHEQSLREKELEYERDCAR